MTNLQNVKNLVTAWKTGTLLFPLPESIHDLRRHIQANSKLALENPDRTDLVELIDHQREHLNECEEALRLVMSTISGPVLDQRCPVCHRPNITKGGYMMPHKTSGEEIMCSGTGRRIKE